MPEQFTNAAQTTLNGAINNAVTSLVVTSATGFPTSGNFRIRIDDEIMTVTAVSGTTFTVSRATENVAGAATAASHANGASVRHVLTVGALQSSMGEILLAQQTASSSATLDFTSVITSTYDEYLIELINIEPATDGAELRVVVSVNNGSSWDTTAGRYYYNNTRLVTTTLTNQNGGGSATFIALTTNVDNGTPNLGVSGGLRIFPTGSGQRWMIGQLHYVPNAGDRSFLFVNADYENGSYNALRFQFSSGNIASGTIRIYGRAK